MDDSQLYPRSNNEDLEVLTGALYSSEDEEGGNGDYSGDGDRAQQRDGEGKKNRAPMLSAEESIRQQMMHSMELTLSAMDPSGGTEVDRRKKMKEEQEKKKIMYTRLMRSSPRSPRPPRQTKKASVTAARQNAYRTFRSSHSTLTRPATARPHRTVNTTTATRSSTKSQSSRTRPHSSTHSHSRHPSQAQERKEVEEARTHLSRMNVTFKGSHLERAITTPRYQLTEFEKQTLFVGHLSERLMKNPYWKNQGRAKSSKKNRKPKKWKFQKKKAKVTSQVEGLVRDADLKAAFNRVKKLPMAEKKEMFELDWDQMVLSDEMVEVEYRSALKEMFWKHYDQIIYIYDYYASAVTVKTKSGDVRSIQRVSLLGFLQFCQICKITDKIVKPRHLNTLFHRCTYKEGMQAGENDEAGDIAGDYDTIIGRENNAFRKHMKHAMKHLYHPAHMLHRAAFMEALIRMALLKFANRLMYLDYPPDQSLHTLMVEFIIPRAILPSDLKSHIRRRMLAEEVDAVLRQYSKRMNGLFLSYCIKDNAHKVKLYVSEFQDLMMQNFESTDRNIPMRVLNGLDPKLEKDSERGNEYFMNFPQFMECFVRVADQEYRQIDTSHKSPDLPLSMKMRQLLSSKWA